MGPGAARHDASRARRDLGRDESRDRRAAHGRLSRASASTTTASRATTSSARSARWSKQYQASETEPIEAMDSLIDWLPENIPPETGDHGRARRLPPRQHDLPSDRAAHPRGARLGALDARRSARRLRLPLHELAHPAGTVPRHRRASTSPRSASRRRASTCDAIASAPAATRDRSGALELLPGLQPVPHRRDPAGHRQARGRRHRGERSTRSTPARARGRWPSSAGNWSEVDGRKFSEESSMNFDYSPKVQELRKQRHGVHGRARLSRTSTSGTSALRSDKRWEPVPIIEELKPKARAAGPVEPVAAEVARRHAHQPRVRAALRDHGPRALGAGGLQLLGARHRQHGDARSSYGTPEQIKAVAASRCSKARSARPSR